MAGRQATALAPQQELSGIRKSAILCMALGPEVAGKIIQQLPAEQVEAIGMEIATLHAVSPDLTRRVLQEFASMARAVESVAQGGIEYARALLEHALGPHRAAAVLARITEQTVETELKKLRQAPPDLLQTVLRGEHPQTAALILAHLDRRQAAEVVAKLDTASAADILYRIARMEKVSPDMLETVEAGLARKADISLSQELTASGGPQAVAQVLNLLQASQEKALLGAIAERSSELAEQIKGLMFVFEDLRLLDGRAMQRLLRDVDAKELALALKAASEELKQHILKNMSERAAQALVEEMEYLGPVRVKDVEAAQSRILAQARALEEAGELVLSAGQGQDALIS
jgi:flagellar motor switch protein FliG